MLQKLGPRSSKPDHFLASLIGLAWGSFVFALHVKYVRQRAPIPIDAYFRALASELTVGPTFFTFWLGHVLRLVGCVLFFCGAWAMGRYMLDWFGKKNDEGIPSSLASVFSLGLGLGICAYAAFALTALGTTPRWLLVSLYSLLSIYGAWHAASFFLAPQTPIDRVPASRGRPSQTLTRSPSITERIIFVYVGLGVAISLIGTTSPEIFYDALVYHLAVPQTYLQAGRMVDLPFNHFSYLPLLNSMLYFWGLAVDGMYSAKLINFFLGLGILWGINSWGRFLKDSELGLVACGFFISTPLVLYLFWVTGSELGMTLFLLLTFMSYWHWLDNPDARSGSLYLSGVFGGFALASKYTAAFGVSLLILHCGWVFGTRRKSIRQLSLLLYILFLVLPLVPWWTRNFIFTGNPFFPYLVQHFDVKTIDPDLLRSWYAETSHGSPGFSPVQHLKKIWADALLGFQTVPSDYTGPIFLALLPLLACAREIKWARWFAAFLCIILFSMLSTTYVTRFLIPYYAPLCLIFASGIIYSSLNSILRTCIYSLFALMLTFNFFRMSALFFLSSTEGLRVASGGMLPAEYLKKWRNGYPSPPYGAYEYIRRLRLPPQERILISGEPRVFYSPNLSVANAPNDIPVMFALANDSRDPSNLSEKLKAQDIHIILINKADGLRNDLPRYINDRTRSMIVSMLGSHFERVYEDDWTAVYARKSHFGRAPEPQHGS